MGRLSIVGVVLAGLVSAAPAARAQDPIVDAPNQGARLAFGREHAGKIREEIKLHEQRAHELEPIIARDQQARRDVETDWIVLERHARDLHGRANDFRAYANEGMSPRAQADMNTFATELDQSATHDEENARMQHEIAERLDRAVQGATAIHDWHLKLAQRLRDWLQANSY
jgi:hypothetical protein